MATDLLFDDAQTSNMSQSHHGSMKKNDSMDGRTSIKKQLAQMLAKGGEQGSMDEMQMLRESSRGLDKFRKSVIQQQSEKYLMKKSKNPNNKRL